MKLILVLYKPWGCIASTGLYVNKLQVVVDYKDVNFDQKINANKSISALRAEKKAIIAELQSLYGARPALALAA